MGLGSVETVALYGETTIVLVTTSFLNSNDLCWKLSWSQLVSWVQPIAMVTACCSQVI